MFAGAAFVDMYHLQSEGYRFRSDARKTFYHRVWLLYDYLRGNSGRAGCATDANEAADAATNRKYGHRLSIAAAA
ncbi:hypothetical protein BJX65DRAFT_314882 [Aspergillus insuetus]